MARRGDDTILGDALEAFIPSSTSTAASWTPPSRTVASG